MVTTQCASQHLTGTGCAAVGQDDDGLPGQLPLLAGKHLFRKGSCLHKGGSLHASGSHMQQGPSDPAVVSLQKFVRPAQVSEPVVDLDMNQVGHFPSMVCSVCIL